MQLKMHLKKRTLQFLEETSLRNMCKYFTFVCCMYFYLFNLLFTSGMCFNRHCIKLIINDLSTQNKNETSNSNQIN